MNAKAFPIAAVALALCAGLFLMVAPEAAHAATAIAHGHAGILPHDLAPGDIVQAIGLVALRRKRDKAKKDADAKIGEITDDTPEDRAREIETEHEQMLRDLADLDTQIAEKEAEEDGGTATRNGPGGDPENDPDNARRNANPSRRQPRQTPPEMTGADVTEMFDIGHRAGMEHATIVQAVNDQVGLDAFRSQAFDHLAEQSRTTRTEPGRVTRDEQETRRDALTEAMAYRMGAPVPEAGPSEQARPFMSYRRFSSFVAEAVGHEGRVDSARSLDDLIDRAAHTTSDFPAIYEGAINRTLEGRYALAMPTYRAIARRRDFRDFRPHTTVKLGDFPMLQKVAEDGEIKYGSFSEGKEQVQAFAYARALAVTRQMIVNDDLGAIAEMLAAYGDTVALFEEITFYSQAFNGKLADGKAVFHADHLNLAGTGAAITVDSVAAGRAAMSKQKSLDGNPMLSNTPRILLCGPDKITEAEKLVASITPATMANVNIFSGRLQPLETAQIAANAWHLLPDPAAGTNYRYGMLDGYDAPRVRMDEPFGRQGFAMSVEHDFGVGATDYRFGYKNPGA